MLTPSFDWVLLGVDLKKTYDDIVSGRCSYTMKGDVLDDLSDILIETLEFLGQ